eukprot:TRINITY_DN9364_c0_g2_i2.p1 TRINITY_DN9364_c0_g2~~TRINITY_DN9364_c0_g2_i2.p1  ORF type:complete len:223 (-),score=70.60 TRINITY_DN9364_c0_g2_i2:136-804(-)
MRFLVLSLLIYLARPFNFKMRYNTEFCLIEDLFEEGVIEITYETHFQSESEKLEYLLHSTELNKKNEGISCTIYQPDMTQKQLILENIRGTIKFPAEQEGKHRVCFLNRLASSSSSKEEVTMTLKFPRISFFYGEETPTRNATGDDHLLHLANYSEVLTGKAKDLGKSQDYEIEKEGEFKDTISKTNSMIQWCAIIQAVVFCILGAWQIISLRRFFAKRGLA